jgi:hypothetical protein
LFYVLEDFQVSFAIHFLYKTILLRCDMLCMTWSPSIVDLGKYTMCTCTEWVFAILEEVIYKYKLNHLGISFFHLSISWFSRYSIHRLSREGIEIFCYSYKFVYLKCRLSFRIHGPYTKCSKLSVRKISVTSIVLFVLWQGLNI